MHYKNNPVIEGNLGYLLVQRSFTVTCKFVLITVYSILAYRFVFITTYLSLVSMSFRIVCVVKSIFAASA
jgi:hypothetical protein